MSTAPGLPKKQAAPAKAEVDDAARRFVIANGLQNVGDSITAAKTVLPWLLAAGGAPAFVTAMLVPIRESGSMLPQQFLSPWVVQHPSRKKIWVAGSIVQGFSATAIGASFFTLHGWVLGIAVLAWLSILSLGRSLCSITSKDVQGRIIPKGQRGVITGRAARLGGIAALFVGAILLVIDSATILTWLIIASGGCWFLAAAVFSKIREPQPAAEASTTFAPTTAEATTRPDSQNAAETGKKPETTSGAADVGKQKGVPDGTGAASQVPAEGQSASVRPVATATKKPPSAWGLLRDNAAFRRFVGVRCLLLVTALSTSFLVVGSHELGVGVFVLAAGLAAIVGGHISGKLSDLSSRLVMAWGSLIASITIALAIAFPALSPLAFFIVSLVHAGIRVARKTYVVDMSEGDERTFIVGAANTIMGVVLLVVGAISGAMAACGTQMALGFLAALGIFGFLGALRLEEVSAPR